METQQQTILPLILAPVEQISPPDYLTSEGGHAQFVKLGIGGDGSLNQITATNPLPVQTYALNPNWTTLPVGGGTGGQGITVNAQITVGNVNFVRVLHLIKLFRVFPPIYETRAESPLDQILVHTLKVEGIYSYHLRWSRHPRLHLDL